MAINATQSGSGLNSLANEVAIYYEKRFLERARAMLIHQEGGQLRGIDGNVGRLASLFRSLACRLTPVME